MDLGIDGRTAAIAASSAGLGFSTAKALAEAGCRVVISGRNPDRLAGAAEALDGAIAVPADVSTPEGATSFVDAAIDALGSIDILVTNAGGPPGGTFATTALEAYPEAINLNLMSVIAMCQAAVPAMTHRRWGRVVAITSISVRQPIPYLILSNTARAGATGFLKTLALEVAPSGVTVNSIQPGLHLTARLQALYDGSPDTSGVPVGFIGDPDDFGATAAFLCSEQARFITGIALPVDGGAHQGLQ